MNVARGRVWMVGHSWALEYSDAGCLGIESLHEWAEVSQVEDPFDAMDCVQQPTSSCQVARACITEMGYVPSMMLVDDEVWIDGDIGTSPSVNRTTIERIHPVGLAFDRELRDDPPSELIRLAEQACLLGIRAQFGRNFRVRCRKCIAQRLAASCSPIDDVIRGYSCLRWPQD